MRVLHVTNFFPPYRTGGAEVAAYNSCLGMRRRGIECAVLCIHARQPGVRRHYRISGIPVRQVYRREQIRWAWRDVFSPWVYRLVREEIHRFKPDLIHTHNVSGMSLAPFVASRRARVPVVATLHDFWLLCPNNMLYKADDQQCDPSQSAGSCGACFRHYDFWGNIPMRRRVFAALVSNVQVFIAPSRNLIEQHGCAGYESRLFRLIPHGIPRTELILHDRRLHKVLEDCGRSKRLLYAGGPILIKGVETILAALPTLVRRIDGFRLLVTGGSMGKYTQPLLAFRPAVQLLGQTSFQDMPALYAVSDLTAMPSTAQESFGLVAAESLIAGTPVVGSNLGGIPEIVRDGETGYLIPPNDPQALAERALEHFARPAIWRRQMRLRCVQRGHDIVSWEKHLDRLGAVYAEVT